MASPKRSESGVVQGETTGGPHHTTPLLLSRPFHYPQLKLLVARAVCSTFAKGGELGVFKKEGAQQQGNFKGVRSGMLKN